MYIYVYIKLICSATHLILTQHKSNILQLKNKFILKHQCSNTKSFPIIFYNYRALLNLI